MVRMISRPARVKPRSPARLPVAVVFLAIHRLSGSDALDVVDAGLSGVVRIGRRRVDAGVGIVRIGCGGDFLPIGLAGHRILWDGADVVLLLELLAAVRGTLRC